MDATISLTDYQEQRRTLCRWMIDRDAIPDVRQGMWEATGWAGRHLLIARVFLGLRMENEPTDLVSIAHELHQRGWYDRAGGLDYLAGILNESLPGGW